MRLPQRMHAVACLAVVMFLTSGIGAEDLFAKLPPGVFLRKRLETTREQRDAIGEKLGGTIAELANTFLEVHGRPIQVNVITAADDLSAAAVFQALLKIKPEPFVVRRDRMIVEYVGKDIDEAVARKTSYELQLVPRPTRVRYRVAVELATIDRADYQACNPLFNHFLAIRAGGAPASTLSEIAALVKGFQFGRALVLRNPKLSDPPATHRFEPMPTQTEEQGSTVRYTFPDLPVVHEVPRVKATIELFVDETGLRSEAGHAGPALTAATDRWPASEPGVKALADQITGGKTGNEAKAAAILAWLAPGKNIRFAGATGSRWGTAKVLDQKFGHCWDFADCFVTLCRAAGVPSRQVAGWLYGSSGHVWAEYFREGRGWQQVDPTGGGELPCGIYHIPYFTSENGEMPILYVSMPVIRVVDP